MHTGWITLHRKLINSPVFKDPLALKLWVYLLLSANHKKGSHMVGNQVVIIPRGSNLTGRKSLSQATDIQESKVERLLKMFEKCGKVEQQTFTKYRLISITNYDMYQSSEQQVNSKRTASEQQVNTNNNGNNGNNGNNKEKIARFTPPSLNQVTEYCLQKEFDMDASGFMDFYESNGWKVGKNPMKSWQAATRTWNSRNKLNGGRHDNNNKSKAGNFLDRCIDGWDNS